MSLPSASPYTYPYTAQNPDTGKIITIRNRDDYYEIVEQFKINRFIYAELVGDIRELIDEKAQQDLQRFIYSKNWGLSPYPGSFDDQPAAWVDKVQIIQRAINEAETVKAKRNK
jgi:hypothetical protein